MAELLLVNPKRRRHRRKMSALQRQYFGGGRKARRAPARRRRRTTALLANPARRHRRRSPRITRRRVMRLRRNPSMGSITNQVKGLATPVLAGAGGAIAVDAVLTNFAGYLPLSLTTGTMAPITRIAAALLVGWGIGKVAGRSIGNAATVGAVTITAYGLMRGFLQQNVPQLALGRYQGVNARMGRYTRGGRLGYTGSGMNVGAMGPTNVRPVRPVLN